MENGADKIRINPGNIGSKERIKAVVDTAKERNIPIRVGVNSGSLEKELVEKYHGVTAEGLVESALDKVHIIEELGYDNLVISIKSSDVMMCARAHELIAERRGGNLQRIGFARHFFDAWEKRAGVFNRADELVFENRCRAPADVHARKVVAERFDIVHFLAQVHKVFACLVFLKQEAVEGTV